MNEVAWEVALNRTLLRFLIKGTVLLESGEQEENVLRSLDHHINIYKSLLIKYYVVGVSLT